MPKLNHNNVRSEEQSDRMKLAEEIKLCPFCPEGIIKIHQKEILHQNENWLLTESAFPYEGTAHHYLLIPKKHLVNIAEIDAKSWADFGEIFKFAVEYKKIEGGGLFLRFGDMLKNGSSVEHLHFQLISGESSERESKENRESLRVKLGYRKIALQS